MSLWLAIISTIFFVAWVNCTSNNRVITNENAKTNMPNTIPVIAFIEPRVNMTRNVTAALNNLLWTLL